MFKAIWDVAKIVVPIVLGVGAILLTGGAALGLTTVLGLSTGVLGAGGAAVGIGAAAGGGIGGVASSIVAGLGIGANSLLGTVLTGAVAGAAKGAVVGALTSAVTGGNILKGVEIGALGGAVTGGILGGINGSPATDITQAGKGLGVPGDMGTPASAPLATASSSLDSTLGGARAPVGAVSSGTLAPLNANAAASGTASDGVAGNAHAAPPSTQITQPAAAVAPTAPASGPAASTVVPNQVVQPPPATGSATPPPTESRGLFGSLWDEVKNSELVGKTLGGLGQALLTGDPAADAAKAGIKRDQADAALYAGNYQSANPGALYGSAPALQQPNGTAPLPTPVQRFDPGGRYVYDKATRGLVFIPYNAAAATG